MQTQTMQNQFFDMYRAGFKTAADMMIASLQSTQRMQQQQLEAMNHLLEEEVKSMRELCEAKNMNDLVAAQTRVTGSQVELAIDFWNRLWRATSESGIGLASASTGTAAAAAGTAGEASQRIQQAAQQQGKPR